MKSKTKTGEMALIALMAAVLAVVAQITLPIGPIPFSMGTFGVFLIGGLLSPLSGCAAVGVYMFLGVIGIPVFAQFRAGPQVLFGPTGGYLIGYFLIVLAVSFAQKRGWNLALQWSAAMVGMACCYLLGTLWFMLMSKSGFLQAATLCVLPFIVPDMAKAALALALAKLLRRRMAPQGRAAG